MKSLTLPENVLLDPVDVVDLYERGYTSVHDHSTGYARLNTGEYLHRVLMDPPDGMVVDHINSDTRDNRRHNLQVCTQQVNAMKKDIKTPSGVRGVSWYPTTQKWVARITIAQRRTHLGYFDEFEDAVVARKQAERDMI